jgi:IPT/TIG domain
LPVNTSPARRRGLRRKVTLLACLAVSAASAVALAGPALADTEIQITGPASPVTVSTPYTYTVTIPGTSSSASNNFITVDLSGAAATFTGYSGQSGDELIFCTLSGATARCEDTVPQPSSETLTLTVLPAAAGTVTASATLSGSLTGTASTTTTIVSATPAPAVTAISPASGTTAGGTPVTITGTGLSGATAVDFGTTAATAVSCTATSCTVTSPAGAAGTVNVTVTTPGGTSPTSAADQYTYIAPPAVTAISPASGPAAGGTVVTITGTSLSGATAVDFGTTAATAVSCTATSCNVTSPAGAAGIVDVTVTTPVGTSAVSSAGRYTYSPDTTSLTAGPILFSISPGQLTLTLTLSATLTDTVSGQPAAGQAISFTVGTLTVCTATTSASGTATCGGPCPVLLALLALHYTAAFAGTPSLAPATAQGQLIQS